MLRSIILGAALFASSAAIACPMQDLAAYEASKEKVTQADGEHVVLAVAGMNCGSCSEKLTATLSEIEGVHAAAVDYVNGEATVAYDAKMVKVDVLVKAITEAGYTAQAPEA